jgi:hypothetical protein
VQAQRDAAAAVARKDEQHQKQVAMLKDMESKVGIWIRVGKYRWVFHREGHQGNEENTRTVNLASNLYDEITHGPREKKLRIRWRDKTGISKRTPLPKLQMSEEKHASEKDASARQKPAAQESWVSYGEHRSKWLTYPGV